ncbi:hemerythrin domain-containing protein [Aliiroseovarius sp. M344]|uniref:hemerythrin domain-containing protein n=1 Tax=Aliiroseovarius sp. M344 TaxID=2867010 RepID=UPI0021ADC890|nr:hemerythrin domain-containing protein [Aliiroseovarius sp. M344]UWQ14920.1 hemerythrin domain-containing protein [Aliiroseovarius sp. M344]
MTHLPNIRQEALPEDMRLLLRDYPRDAWPDHPNFAVSIQNWMGAHIMFGQLAELVRANAEGYLDKQIAPDDHARRLSQYGNLLVQNLHGHHHWEDRSFFPELSSADTRFDKGLDTLEADHIELDDLLDRFTRQANRVVTLTQLDETQAYEEAYAVRDMTSVLQGFLSRHLTDEEDLVVPILLHHKMRG